MEVLRSDANGAQETRDHTSCPARRKLGRGHLRRALVPARPGPGYTSAARQRYRQARPVDLGRYAGAAVAVPSWTSYQADSERLAERDREFGEYPNTRYSTPAPAGGESAPLDDSEDDDEAEKARTSRLRRKRFAQMAIRHLNDQFNKHAPTTRAGRRRWDADTRHLKESLRKELLAQYNEPDLDAGSINWLINFRVQEIARKWRAGSLREYWKRLQPRARESFGAVAGVIFSAIALPTC